MATNAPSWVSPQTSGQVRRSQYLADAIRQMQQTPKEVYNTAEGTNYNILANAILGYQQNQAQNRADRMMADDKTKLADMIRGQFPDQQGVANQQLGQDKAFDLTPGGNEQRAKEGGIGNLASMIFQTTGDPTAAINAGMGQQRQMLEDKRYNDETKYAHGRDARGDFVADRGFGEGVRQFDANYNQNADQFGQTMGLQRDQFGEVKRHNKASEAADAATVAAKLAASGMPDPSKETPFVNQYLGEAKTFKDVKDAFNRVRAVGSASNPAEQMSLIFGYMKMLDPGSTVREGEYATAQNTTGVPGWLANAYNKAASGQFLNDQQVKDFVAQAGQQYKAAADAYEPTLNQYRQRAQAYGMQPDIIQDFRLGDLSQISPAGAGGPVTAPNGQTFSRDEAINVRNFMSNLPPQLRDEAFIAQLDQALSGASPQESPRAPAAPSVDDLVNKYRSR